MSRKIFISFQYEDQMKAKGFNLLRWNKQVDVEFVGRHLLEPLDSKNESYIRSRVTELLNGTSVTVVLLGEKTHTSKFVAWEIEQSMGKPIPNGVLAIKLSEKVPIPENSPVAQALDKAGAEIISWSPHEFGNAIERAALTAGRVSMIKKYGDIDESCTR